MALKNNNIDIILVKDLVLVRIPSVYSIIDFKNAFFFFLQDSLNSLAQKSGIENPFSDEI